MFPKDPRKYSSDWRLVLDVFPRFLPLSSSSTRTKSPLDRQLLLHSVSSLCMVTGTQGPGTWYTDQDLGSSALSHQEFWVRVSSRRASWEKQSGMSGSFHGPSAPHSGQPRCHTVINHIFLYSPGDCSQDFAHVRHIAL